MGRPVLGYWRIRGLAQAIRYLLAYCAVDYEDKLYEQANDFNKECWFREKFTLNLDFPNLPYFLDDDVLLTETSAILKYISKKYRPELLGKTAADVGRAQMLENIIGELKAEISNGCYGAGDRGGIISKTTDGIESVASYLKKYNFLFLAGNDISYVDFIFYEQLELLDFIWEGNLFNQWPILLTYHQRVHSIKEISEYRSKHANLPFNNKHAKLNK